MTRCPATNGETVPRTRSLSPRRTTWSWPRRWTRSSLSDIAPAAGAGAGGGVGVGVGAGGGGVGVGVGGVWAAATAVKLSGNRLPMMIAATRRIERGIVHVRAAKSRRLARHTLPLHTAGPSAARRDDHPARVTPTHPAVEQHRRMASTEPSAAPKAKSPARKGQNARVIGAASLGAVVTLFAVLNLDDVDVNWIFGTASTPLIVVILLCVALGMAIDRGLVRRGRRRQSTRRK